MIYMKIKQLKKQNSFDLPTIGIEQNKNITQEITEEEIHKAISRLKTNKMAGDDGYPAEWYKTFRGTINPLLKNRFKLCP